MSSHCPLYKAGIYLSPSLLILYRDLSTPKTYRKCPDESISVMLKWWVQNTRGNRERGVINDKTKVQIALIKLMNTVEPSALCLKSSKDCNPNKNPESHILIQHTKHPKVSGTHSLVPLSSTPHPKKFTVPLGRAARAFGSWTPQRIIGHVSSQLQDRVNTL